MKKEKLKTGSKAWKKSLLEAMITYAPVFVECKRCGGITPDGYVCPCGCDDPGNDVVDPEDWFEI